MSASEPHVFPLGHEAKHAITASVVLMSVAIIMLVARFYTRRHLIDAVQASDYMALLASMFAVTFVGIFIAATIYGVGQHEQDIEPLDLIQQKKLFWLSNPFYNAAMVTAKASITIQYSHVFPTRKMRIVCWTMTAFIAIYGTWVILSAFLNCIPVARFWDPTIAGHCISYKPLWYSTAALNITSDVMIWIIPIPAMTPVDILLRQKIVCCCVFALGGLVCVMSAFRLYSLTILFNSPDPSYHALAVLMWSAIECNTGIICACLPTLRPAICRIWPAISSIHRRRRGRGSSDTITSFYGRGNESAAAPIVHETHFAARELESNRGSVATTKPGSSAGASGSSGGGGCGSMQQLHNIRMIPMPGNGFAQDLARKGSFFEQQQQRPSSYV